ncbi:hypothetical protein VHEMI00825 [[Torrubiella] hemipterigena]|uniref:Uncharacterized protein n=1 Tax=[Torrubiella] hemipterigena TaxID=1531966 RepID=A0A0A1T5R7_9HYPO|nr:hypothetical protein VHEMI00825 [[Torrubiella] hemipterigena]
MSNPSETRRRFAPIPIETTFQSVRKGPRAIEPYGGPSPELTPEPSPRQLSPVETVKDALPRRRFAPQLIESSRRTFRLGDSGPATKPTDKTDITPYTNHIYLSRTKSRRRRDEEVTEEELEQRIPPTRRETEEDGVKEYLLELAAKEADRQMQEDALAAFPNSRAREGGVAHFYFREGSVSDSSGQVSPGDEQISEPQTRHRRKSSHLGLNWWHKHMQDHAEKLAHLRRGDEDNEEAVVDDEEDDRNKQRDMDRDLIRSDSDLDRMELPGPPDPMWTTDTRIPPDVYRRDTDAEEAEALALAARLARASVQNVFPGAGPPPQGRDAAQLLSSAATQQQQQQQQQSQPPQTTTTQQQPHDQQAQRQNNQGPFGRPFAALGLKPDEAQLRRLRQFVSPPMLGSELKFRKCPSPKQTKLETDHPFNKRRHDEGCAHEERDRDMSGKGGLWRGYCCRSESTGGYLVPADLQPTKMLATPFPPATPLAYEVDSPVASSEEPPSILSTSASSDSVGSLDVYYHHGSDDDEDDGGIVPRRPGATITVTEHGTNAAATTKRSHRSGNNSNRLHVLHGLDKRLEQEKARADLDEKIAADFDDAFVTQVYNYLSLGYPAMARSFDDELSKITRVSVEELRSKDEAAAGIKGHMLEMTLDDNVADEDRCPRWRALRTYIYEWARQHPDLDNLDPLAWGVRERRGSWAI